MKINKKNSALLFVFLLSLLLTGCSDPVEVQNRDFALALGVSLKEDKFEFTFGLPDLSQVSKDNEEKSSSPPRTYESFSPEEIENLYNHGSNKSLDYRHLEALILDEAISASSEKLNALFEYMDNNFQISRDVRVFYYCENVKELIEEKGKISGGIGDYLEKLEKNNQRKNGLPTVTLGNLIDSFYQEKDILIPIIESSPESLRVNGAAIFQDSIFKKILTEEELHIYYIIKGQGKEFTFQTEENIVFKLKEFSSKTDYQLRDNKPIIYLSIAGVIENLYPKSNDNDLENKINLYLHNAINDQIDLCFKKERLDYLNLYCESSLKNRDIWIIYQNRLADFINDTEIIVCIDVEIR